MSTHRGNLVVTNDLQVAGTFGINESNPQGTLQISAVEGAATLVVDGMTDAGKNIAGTLSIVGKPSVVVMGNSAGTPTFTATVSGTNLLGWW